MITRRGFFGLLGGALAAEAARKIYVLPPMGGWRCAGGLITPGEVIFYINHEGWSYRYMYRNEITGHVSDATSDITKLVHTFAYPEVDVIDIYRQMNGGDLEWAESLRGVHGFS